ncbi:hypothetical protein LguiA_018621 [Lonicera macranthoides]
MVSEGAKIFDNMVEKYGVVPQLDHFACMVDIIGRAGRIVEAETLITKMPMGPDSVVWSALLGACRKHGKTELANLAAAKLKELDPKNSLGYVLMSNIYCSAGSFSEAGLMRKEMKTLGVKKRPGLSWAEIGNRVHEFASGGLRHPQGEAIRDKLEEMVKQLKGLGYVPETSLVLHDVEEEHKAEQLYYHSENLALIFALMNTGGFYPGGVIRIIKNIRICVDCHNFMKFASKLVQREIIVRDSNRFRHFRGRRESKLKPANRTKHPLGDIRLMFPGEGTTRHSTDKICSLSSLRGYMDPVTYGNAASMLVLKAFVSHYWTLVKYMRNGLLLV